MALLEIHCPMCKGIIILDPSTGTIVEHKVPEQKKADLSDFLKSQKTRGSDLENMFKKSKIEQDKRKSQLDEEFKKAKEHPENLKGDDSYSPFKWD
jgi:hypothetical protein